MTRALALASVAWLVVVASPGAPPDGELYYNQDCTEFFFGADVPAGEAGVSIDRYVDRIADAGATVFFCNTNSRRTNYRSRAWDAFWDGYDPSGPDDQPFLKPVPPEQKPGFRRMVDNMLQADREGVDYPARVLARCRDRKMSPWISLRMNDCHENDVPDHPFHGSFWVRNPGLRLQNRTGYFANCLDYARPEVRDFFMTLVEETLDRYDVDGLELDFMREPYVFGAGEEKEGAPVLTEWLREVRRRTAAAAVRRGHSVKLGVRVPSRPETALGMGLDAIAWAKEGIVDLLVVTPRWATLEFDMPISEWRRLLGDARATLVGGLEILYRPWPGAPAGAVSPELARGAAALVLADGADAVYLFNHFPGVMPEPVYRDTLRAMKSLESLSAGPRTIGVTYRDVVAPGESYRPPLPAEGAETRFSMRLGPEPPRDWRREVVVGFASRAGSPPLKPLVFLDGDPCELVDRAEADGGSSTMTFQAPVRPREGLPTHEVKVASEDGTPLVVQRVEVKLRP